MMANNMLLTASGSLKKSKTKKNKTKQNKNQDTNGNKITVVKNLWDAVKTVLRGKLIGLQSYLKKQEKSQINNLT